MSKPLNSADYERIEASLRSTIYQLLEDGYPADYPAYQRTLDKIEKINQTGKYTPQRGTR